MLYDVWYIAHLSGRLTVDAKDEEQARAMVIDSSNEKLLKGIDNTIQGHFDVVINVVDRVNEELMMEE
jgi:hypothetical protein